jgi:CHRD domain/PEP-CTERM motif
MRQIAFGILCVGLLARQSSAGILVYVDSMFGGNETPANGSTASGHATVTVDTVLNTLMINETWTGLTGGAASAAHIHCCAGPGVAAAVALPFNTFPTTTSGTFSLTYDLTQAATYTGAFVTAAGGTAALAESLLLSSMASGQTYTNIHNATFPGGEIRGQLAAIPEPGTMSVAGASLIGLIGVLRRRRRS